MGCIPAKDTVLKIRVIDPPEDKVKSADFRLLTNNYSIQPQILGRGKFGKVKGDAYVEGQLVTEAVFSFALVDKENK